MSTNRDDYHRRLQEFEGLKPEFTNNTIVHKFVSMYAAREIITKEETLCQMVKALCANWSQIQRQNYDNSMAMIGHQSLQA